MRHFPNKSQTPAPKICVVGAGVSGLRAAGLLATAGFNVTAVEARDRVGGRVHQTPRFGLSVDIGASWIHGTQGNLLIHLAQKANATTVACGAVESICDSAGTWLSRGRASQHYKEVWEILEMAMEKSRNESLGIPDSVRMMDFVRSEVESRRENATEPPETYERLILSITEMLGGFHGDDCERQSLRNPWLDAGLEGGIVADLLAPVAEAACLRLGCEVTKITYRNGTVDIEAADGFADSFGDVIVTAPLGWLKRNEDVFSPPLTSELSTAIRHLGYGNLDRVFVKFPRAFWNTHVDGTQISGQPAFPIESLFLSPEYAIHTNPAKWRVEIISLAGIPEPFAQPIIMFFIYGQWGRHITGLVRGMTQDSEEYCRIMDEHFRPYYSKLPNYDTASDDCRPLEYLSTDWQNDHLAGYGSFTNLPVGSGDCNLHFEALRNGMSNRGIWFAGEHTSPPGGLGTVTGALWSGEEVAKRVTQRRSS